MPDKRKRKKRRKVHYGRLLSLMACALLVIFGSIFALYRAFNPVSLRASQYYVEVGEDFEPLDNLRYVFFGSDEQVKVVGYEQVDPGVVGTYPMIYTYNEKEYPFTVVVQDTTPPELVVHDYATDLFEEIDAIEAIQSVSDASPFRVRVTSDQNFSESGSSRITISAADTYGNSVSKTVTITRQEDQTAPEITGLADTLDIGVGEAFYPDLTVVDDLDANPTLKIDKGNLDVDTPGTYTVSYTVSDRSGNSRSYTQNVRVRNENIVYLTFDDGPSVNTQYILDVLDQYNVKATFFVTAQNPEYFDLMTRAAQAGHTVALHTATHDFAKVYASPEAYFDDLDKIQKIVKKYTGKEADCIRFPGGSSNTTSANYSKGIMSELVNLVHEAGYEYFDWNVDSQDASGTNVSVGTIYQGALSGLGEPFAVILMHDTEAKSTTVQALPSIIEAYLAAGYDFEPLTKESYTAHHGLNN